MRTGRFSIVAAAIVVGCLGPVSSTTAHASLPSVGVCAADHELMLGDTGASVICLQFALGMMHLTDNPITGTYDQATADVVKWFQGTHPPLLPDGRAGPQTLVALGIWSGTTTGTATAGSTIGTASGVTTTGCTADATIKPGDAGQSVACLQDTLRELGLYSGKTTGKDDLATVGALEAFQKDTPPLRVDGYAGPRTLAAMGIWSGNANGASVYAAAGSQVPGFAPPGPWPAPLQLLPSWNETPNGIPYFGNHNPCSLADADMIAYQFGKDGADVATQQWAVYIASREGGCAYNRVNINPATADDSHCTFQLNVLSGTFAPGGELGRRGWTPDSVTVSMQACADAASDLWVYCGRGPWTPPYSCRPPWKDSALTADTTPIVIGGTGTGGDLGGGDVSGDTAGTSVTVIPTSPTTPATVPTGSTTTTPADAGTPALVP